MATQTIDLLNTDVVNFNENEVKALYLNSKLIWGNQEDAHILQCTPKTAIANDGTSHTFEFVVSTGETGGTISIINDNTFTPITVEPNCSAVTIDLSACIIANPIVKFVGGFTNIGPIVYKKDSQSAYKPSTVINKVISWLGSQTSNPINNINQFQYADFTQDFAIPDNINSIKLSSLFEKADLSKIRLHININCKEIYSFTSLVASILPYKFPKNAIKGENCWSVSNIAVLTYGGTADNENIICIPNGTQRLARDLILDSSYIKKIIIPSSVNKIDTSSLCYATGKDKTIQFNHAQDDVIDLPATSGDGKGIAYYKNARNITIITDNLIIKNYDWAGDNVTATFKHLDGSEWE